MTESNLSNGKNKDRKITKLANGKIKFRQHVYIELTEEDYKKFTDEVDTKFSAFFTKLIEEHYDNSIVKVQIDERIRDAYENDIYRDFRIQMLLLNYYLNGKTENLDSRNQLNEDNINKDTFNDEYLMADSDTEKKEYLIKKDKTKDIIETFEDTNINKIIDDPKVAVEETANSIEELEYTHHNENRELNIIDDSKLSTKINDTIEKENIKIHKEQVEIFTKKPSGTSGSLDEIMPRNNKSILR
ncbi:hypothetical protein OD350_29105 (plasmid) [Clostridium beijerinckii]|uniref:hypothetical protein n=1 Tax=Clostridium beijerinckii TaxID=1520 RepID=UPI002226DADC|nr:hypothetical protein [Clostridium beijerinckii]UYZ38948.1 hypothetical protein OD350_29105 [Clostridium beijerinckii]